MKKFLTLAALCVAVPQIAFATYGSCNFREESTCVQYNGSDYAQSRGQIEQACTDESGEFSTNSCPAQSRVGQCHVDESGSTYYAISFYSPTTTDDAKISCGLMSGRFE